jgi:hypothetical protein
MGACLTDARRRTLDGTALTGRPHTLTTADGDPAPDLGPWL